MKLTRIITLSLATVLLTACGGGEESGEGTEGEEGTEATGSFGNIIIGDISGDNVFRGLKLGMTEEEIKSAEKAQFGEKSESAFGYTLEYYSSEGGRTSTSTISYDLAYMNGSQTATLDEIWLEIPLDEEADGKPIMEDISSAYNDKLGDGKDYDEGAGTKWETDDFDVDLSQKGYVILLKITS